MIKSITKYQNNANEDGATISIWYVVEYKCGRCREFKHLPKSGKKFMKNAKPVFQSFLSPVGYSDTKGIKRGNPDKTCDYGETQYTTIYEEEGSIC